MTDPIVYKLLTRAQWEDFLDTGRFIGAPVDLKDGFIHLSAAHQVRETAARHFAGQEDLELVGLVSEALDLRWEVSRGGEPFPHVYSPLFLEAVAWHAPLPWEDGQHWFPALPHS